MKLWKISQKEVEGWDTYDSAVVLSETAEAAQRIHPGIARYNSPSQEVSEEDLREYDQYWLTVNNDSWDTYPNKHTWSRYWATKLENVTVTYLGEYSGPEQKCPIICASFNAG